MISVENFYWVLYQNLLAPSGLNCWYYYPWGTKNHISRHEYKKFDRVSDLNYVLFHFDQEPLYESNLGKLHDEKMPTWSTRFCKILANSEKSLLKKDLCRERFMLDWYFFYHGFAALDWFRDLEFIDTEHPIANAFLSLNHLIQDTRSYRLNLTSRLIDRNLVPYGSISLHTSLNDIREELEDSQSYLSLQGRDIISKNLHRMTDLPWRLDKIEVGGNLSAHFGHAQHTLWQKSLFHIVNESVFYQPKLHLTEKIFKPIVAGRPFILAAAPGNLEYLRSYGFRTFGDWIDESYDQETDPDIRLDMITTEIEKICMLSVTDLRNMLEQMRSVLQHNKVHFFNDFRRLITNEMVDNFCTCIRIWNHGRVDGREIPLHPDPDSVKQILLR
jgi:hypothetical protein